ALLTDLYQLTMLQAYAAHRMEEPAVFEFFVRRLPPQRGFLLAAGLEQALAYLETLRVQPDELGWLAKDGRFTKEFLQYLERLRFTGDVHAMPEGTVFFPNEPILRVTAPIPQAQLVESRLINLLQLETVIASKAARSVLAAPGKLLVDFGMRRAHGAEAALLAARASYLAGFSGTSNVLAGRAFGIPLYGTVAHAFIEAHDDEAEAFVRFAKAQQGPVTFLLDTYDTEAAARTVVSLAPRLKRDGVRIGAIRLDSGDLAAHAKQVRHILDAGGLGEVKIFSSGGLDELELFSLLKAGAPIDGFGVGTQLGASADAPVLDCAYKLEEYAGRPRAKRSEGKATLPGRKQVHRTYGPDGRMAFDTLSLEAERVEGEALLVPVMRGGRRFGEAPSLAETRARAAQELARLPEDLRRMIPEPPYPPYPVKVSRGLEELAGRLAAS
ncbi:MAG: nicotinate phosphoribosyltransferase, partial [Candidatus Omnitrophica bacterium]|nr:nicotinate phosphoribosyltransferase [Candidatus Omnitrophota bacterium]